MACLYYVLYCPEVEVFTALFKNRADIQVFAFRVVKTVIEMNIDEQGARWAWGQSGKNQRGLLRDCDYGWSIEAGKPITKQLMLQR